ncbi:MAG: DUF2971 domain-containing protein [Alphaproteobacteria bacterium]|nr:DUF2971 domain-containing protein [Alphaproteobacteria bacterium]
MLTPNNKEHFFKYLSLSSLKHVLKGGSLKWSHPSLFNDPFDNQLDFLPIEDKDLMAEETHNAFMAQLTSDSPVEGYQSNSMSSIIETLRQIFKTNRVRLNDDQIAYLKEGATESVRRAIEGFPKINDAVKKILSDTSIICVSETHDNLLMWAHYSENHEGAVIKLLSPTNNSFLRTAQKVVYTEDIPRFTANDLLSSVSHEKVLHRLTLTKSTHWEYEKEWRVVSTARNKATLWEAIPFFERELGAIYLGCRMKEETRNEIIELARSRYSHVEIYQAQKHDTKFALTFNKI